MVQHRGWFYLAITILPWLGVYAILQVALNNAG